MIERKTDILPEHNASMNAVPQILSKNAQDVVATCEMLKELGYKEVKNIHIHLTRLLLHFLLMYRQQHLHLEEYLQTIMTFCLFSKIGSSIRKINMSGISYKVF